MTTERTPVTWDDLKDLLRWFGTLFGGPEKLYQDQVVRKKDGLTIRGWIAGLEAIARALLMAMAAALPKPETTLRARQPAARKQRTAKDPSADDIVLGVFDVPDSERWAGVSFVLAPKEPPERTRRPPGDAPSSLMKTRPLAYRLEALIRVVRQPERYAKRLAARLHADPKLASRVLRQPKPIGCRSFPRQDVEDAQAQGWSAHAVFAPNTG